MSRQMRGAWIMLVLMLPPCAASALEGETPPASHACATVVDPWQRLACYDRAFPPPAEAHAAAVSKARSEFGLDHASQSAPAAAELDPDQILAALVRVDYHDGSRTFTLQTGQVWQQTDGVGSGNVAPGETVRIRKAMFGSYMLVMPSGVAVRVKRLR